MKNILLILLLNCNFFSAQNNRFIYEYSFALDSTNTPELQKEMLVLDVNPTGSKFYSYEKFKSDSLLSIDIEKQKNSGSGTIQVKHSYKGKIKYTVSKNYPDFKTFLHIRIGTDQYKVFDDRKMSWKILPEKQKIRGFDVQKAETEMFGRKWTAWFTTEIPVQDGPYKFSGLPGLIVKIEDLTKTHTFELKGISRNSANPNLKVSNNLLNVKEIPVSYAQYKKMHLEDYNDPTKTLRKLMLEAGPNLKCLVQMVLN